MDALLDQAGIDLGGGLVDAEFDNREVGRRGLEIIADGEARQIELHLVEFFETAPEVNEQQIALMTEQREQRTLAPLVRASPRAASAVVASCQDFGARGIGECAPCGAGGNASSGATRWRLPH